MHVYFSGIGGAGLGPLALLSLECGYKVSGSDLSDSMFSEKASASGVNLQIGNQDGSYLQKIHDDEQVDWLVYSAAIPEDSPELLLARNLGIKTSKRDGLINYILQDKSLKLISVTGTHGKTTTTSMIIWLFHQLGVPVSYQVGTNLPWAKSAGYDEKSDYFIYEADEYDRNMLKFHSEIAVIPSLDYDHPDTYPTLEDYQEAFRQFSRQSTKLITWQKIADAAKLENTSTISDDEDLSVFNLAGSQNRHNARLSLEVAKEALGNIDLAESNKILSKFPGTERRFEKLAENLYTDYAHHPNEVAATVGAALELSQNVVVVYQPHQDRRQREVADLYENAFVGAKKIYWLPTYNPKGRDNQDALKPQDLIRILSNNDLAEVTELGEKLKSKIQNHLQNGDLVLACSAGDLDTWLRQNF